MNVPSFDKVEMTVAGLDGLRHLTPLDAMSGDLLDNFALLGKNLEEATEKGNFGQVNQAINALLGLATDLNPDDLRKLQVGQRRAILKAISTTNAEPEAEKKTRR